MSRLVFALLCACLTGCSASRFAKLHVLSDPPGAHVSIVETGEYLGTAPDTRVIRERFHFWQPRRVRYHLLFETNQGWQHVVQLSIRDAWFRTRSEAIASVEYRTVHGLLKAPTCPEP